MYCIYKFDFETDQTAEIVVFKYVTKTSRKELTLQSPPNLLNVISKLKKISTTIPIEMIDRYYFQVPK